MQYYILFVSVVIASNEDFEVNSSGRCRKYVGVYYLSINLRPNLTLYEVATFNSDETFDTIDSLADGNSFSSTPPFGSYSNLKGIWKCQGRNEIEVNTFNFNYPTSIIPRYVSTAIFYFQFNEDDQVLGNVSYINYNLISTANQNRSQWIKLSGPFQFYLQGYKLF